MNGPRVHWGVLLVSLGLAPALTLSPGAEDPFLDRVLAAARQGDPGFSRDEVIAAIDGLCADVRRAAGVEPTPERWVTALREVLFHDGGYKAAGEIQDTTTLFLPSVMKGKTGSCLGLSTLALVVGERLEIPLHGVAVPNHYFVRYDDGKTRINMEMTRSGKSFPDSWYVEQKGIHPEAIRRGVYLRNVSPRETLGAILQNWALSECAPRGDRKQALEAILRAIDLAPRLPEARRTQGVLLAKEGRTKEAIASLDGALTLHGNDKEALLNRGLVRYASGDVAGALADIDGALLIDPDYPAARRHLDEVGAEVRENHFDAWQGYVARRNRKLQGKLRPGLRGAYYRGREFEEEVAHRVDRKLDFDWKSVSPHPDLPSSRFSIRWDGYIRIPEAATYTFYVAFNDGARLVVDGKALIDVWSDHGWENVYESVEVPLSPGLHDFRVEMFNNRGGSRVILLLGHDRSNEPLETSKLFLHLP